MGVAVWVVLKTQSRYKPFLVLTPYFRRKSLEFRNGQYSFIKFEAPSRATWVSQRCPVFVQVRPWLG
jgi:hypothetical protein